MAPISKVSLRHLHAFSAVAAAGGIRRSSESLFRASSAVARSVAALEESLEVRLFERKGRGMLLTAAGETVRLRADRIEAELREVRDEAIRLRDKAGAKVGGVEALLNERASGGCPAGRDALHAERGAGHGHLAVGHQPGHRTARRHAGPAAVHAHGARHAADRGGAALDRRLRARAGRIAPHPGRHRRDGRHRAGRGDHRRLADGTLAAAAAGDRRGAGKASAPADPLAREVLTTN
jgi:hypothetical protein